MQVNNAQDYTRLLKQRVIGAIATSSPQPATRRYAYVSTAVVANHATQIVQIRNVPHRGCTQAGQTKSDCCT
uniref:Uncharacterized protein n=1 Tax=viral metagenome TaxID=1070528 RepID=A0A6C0J7I5_9ZZZZ